MADSADGRIVQFGELALQCPYDMLQNLRLIDGRATAGCCKRGPCLHGQAEGRERKARLVESQARYLVGRAAEPCVDLEVVSPILQG